MFRGMASKLRFRPAGMKVIAFGRIGVFRDGAYQPTART